MVLKSIGAYAVRLSDPDQPLLADSEETLYRVIALRWIGNWRPSEHQDAAEVRQALLEERWEDAVLKWMDVTGETLDIFPHGLEIHEDRAYPKEEFGLRIQTTPLFDTAATQADDDHRSDATQGDDDHRSDDGVTQNPESADLGAD